MVVRIKGVRRYTAAHVTPQRTQSQHGDNPTTKAQPESFSVSMCVGSVDLSKVKAWLKSGPLAEDEEAQKQTREPGENDWTEEGI